MSSSFQGAVFWLRLSTVKNIHGWEAGNDDYGVSKSMLCFSGLALCLGSFYFIVPMMNICDVIILV